MDHDRAIQPHDNSQVDAPNFGVDFIVRAENFSILSPIGINQATWLQLQLTGNTWLQHHMAMNRDYQQAYRSRGIQVWYSARPIQHTTLYVAMDNSRMGEVHSMVAGWEALKAMLVTLMQEARPEQQNFAGLPQAGRMVIVARMLEEAHLQEPEKSLILTFLATRPGMGYLGINDPSIPTRLGPLPLPDGMEDPAQAENKENVDPEDDQHQNE